MYCINCGVKLSDTEKKCPLCNTAVFHPDIKQPDAPPLYPKDKMPKKASGSKAINGAVIIIFLIPFFATLFFDLANNGKFEWFGYVAGGLVLSYVAFALPFWFKNPNPTVFVPCTFATATLYLMYINLATNGDWFLGFALPIMGALCLIATATAALLRYVKKGKLYTVGGLLMALGATVLLIEFLLVNTFPLPFVGWSIYPAVVLIMLGGLLIYLAISKPAREILERKFFF